MTVATREADALTPFVFDGANLRGALVTLLATNRGVLASHRYPPSVAHALSELCAAAILIASTLKLDGSLILQVAGNGPVKLVVVECTDVLSLRATAQWNDASTAALPVNATLADLAGTDGARFTITLDPRSGPMYQGIVALETTTIARLIEHYLTTSEQLQSRVLLDVRGDDAAGLLLQKLPGTTASDEATWARVSASLDDEPQLLDRPTHRATLSALFPEDDLRVFAPRPTRYACSCSIERVRNALRIAGAAEIEAAIVERGDVEVVCEFCNRRYAFSPAQAREIVS